MENKNGSIHLFLTKGKRSQDYASSQHSLVRLLQKLLPKLGVSVANVPAENCLEVLLPCRVTFGRCLQLATGKSTVILTLGCYCEENLFLRILTKW